MTRQRDHGGDLDRAMRTFGGSESDWLDLSTGINPDAYPFAAPTARDWTALPTRADMATLIDKAAHYYGTTGQVVPLAGAQGAIQLVPRLSAPGEARILGPTYNEHGAALRAAGWQVTQVAAVTDLADADLAVVVNPNNPDGRRVSPARLLALAGQVGRLVVDESFGDVTPALSLAGHVTNRTSGLIVLRSFGKFYGLAGVRLGFALCGEADAQALRDMAGPWNVSGPALALGTQALGDSAWQNRTRARLAENAARLDALAKTAGWRLVGGTTLFRTYGTPDATAARHKLAQAHVWSRIFPYSDRWIRLGLPPQHRWSQVQRALS